MKIIVIASLYLAFFAAGCASRNHTGFSKWLEPHPYSEDDLTLSLAQDPQSADLTLTLKNTSSHSITNEFPETRFEGAVWVVQEGAAPLKTYPSNYFHLMIRALWTNPRVVIAPGGSVTYRIPLETLVSPLSARQPDASRLAFAYALLERFEVFSNTIRLEKPERIQWRTKAVQRTGASRLAQIEIRTSGAVGSRR